MDYYSQRMQRIALGAALLVLIILGGLAAYGQSFTLNLPKRGKLTPIQKLNREGVKEVQKRHLEKAKKLFSK